MATGIIIAIIFSFLLGQHFGKIKGEREMKEWMQKNRM